MGMKNKKGLMLLILLVGLVFFVSGVSAAGSVTRSFSSSSVGQDGQLTVNLSVDMDDIAGEAYYYIEEEFPVGWTIVSTPGSLSVDGRNITWADGPYPEDISISYIVKAPFVDGDYSFVGTYALGSPILFGTLGDDIVSVGFVPPASNPSIEFAPSTTPPGSQENADIYVDLLSDDAESDHYSFVDFDDDLLLWLRMDDTNSSGDPTDLSSWGNDGALVGGTFINESGYWGDASWFDGGGDYIQIGEESLLEDQLEGTMCVWFYAVEVGTQGLVGDRNIGNDVNWTQLMIYSDGEIIFGCKDDTTESAITYGANWQADKWTFTCGAWNSSGIYKYLDGVLDASRTDRSCNFEKSNIYNVNIGTYYDLGSTLRSFNGSIDEVMIFNRSLTSVEIKALYSASVDQYANNFTDLADGDYTFTGHAVDADGNRNWTEDRVVTVGLLPQVEDTVPPEIDFGNGTPSDGSSQNSADIFVNLSTQDDSRHYSFLDFNNDVLLWMRMDDVNSSGDPIDLSSWGNDGALVGGTFINESGYWGNASWFDGVSDTIDAGDLDLGSFTLSAWVRGTFDDSYYMVVRKDSSYYLSIYQDSIHARMFDGSTWKNSQGLDSTFENDRWYHVAATYEEKNVSEGIEDFRVISTIENADILSTSRDYIREIGNVLYDVDETNPSKRYKFYYSVYDGVYGGTNVYAGSATSPDGIDWTEESVLSSASEDPYVVKDGDAYYMYYENKAEVPFQNIALATSSDGIDWTVYGNVLSPQSGGSPVDWEAQDVSSPVVWVEGGVWYMLYEGRGGDYWGKIGLATSSDGINWIRGPDNLVFDASDFGGDSVSVVPDDIRKVNGVYYMIYHGYDGVRGFYTFKATSTDLYNWVRYSDYPLSFRDTDMFMWDETESEYYAFHVRSGDSAVDRLKLEEWNGIRLYVDGVEERKYYNNDQCDELPINQNNNKLYVGSSKGAEFYFNGSIDEVIIFNRSLISSEIKSLYSASVNQYTNNFTDLGEGDYTFTGHAVDVEGNRNWTEDRVVTIDFVSCDDYDGDGYDTCDSDNPSDTDGFEADCVDNPAGMLGVPGDQINPGVVEVCNNEVDDDCDGYVDYYDPDCGGDSTCSLLGYYCSLVPAEVEDVLYPAGDGGCSAPDVCFYNVGQCGDSMGVCTLSPSCFGGTPGEGNLSCALGEGDPGEFYCCENINCEVSGGDCNYISCPGGFLDVGNPWCYDLFGGGTYCCDCAGVCNDLDGDGFDDCVIGVLCDDDLEIDCVDDPVDQFAHLQYPGQEWYYDEDGDNYTDSGTLPVVDCLWPVGTYIPSEWVLGDDCDDANEYINPGLDVIEEYCDCDPSDGMDPVVEEISAGNCGDGFDNDCDGLGDGLDPDCAGECIDAGDCVGYAGVGCIVADCVGSNCIYTEDNGYCWTQDGIYCDGVSECSISEYDAGQSDAEGCIQGSLPCADDGVDCTVDCDEDADSCDYTPDDGLCSDGEICDSDEGCGVAGDCGNGDVEFGEDCDGTNLSYQNCSSQDYPAGDIEGLGLDCNLSCDFDYSGCSLLPRYEKFNGTTTDFSSLLEVQDIGNVLDSLLEINNSGMISYLGSVLNYTRLDLDKYVLIEPLLIGVDLTGNRMSELNYSGVLEFYGVSFNNPIVLRNGAACPEDICNITNYTKGDFLRMNVTGFSVYQVIETPYCGDGACNGGESCSSCPGDCGGCGDPGSPGSSCFPAGTLIKMADGSEKAIEEIGVGEKVLSYDEFSREKSVGVVLELESPVRNHMCEIVFEEGGTLRLTNEHPVYTSEGWKSIDPIETLNENLLLNVGRLEVGDLVRFVDGESELVGVSCWTETVKTYNLKTIFPDNTFYAGGVLVHNKDDGTTITTYQCGDGIDNDLDGLIDYPYDPSCDSAYDNDEFPFDSLVGPGGCSEEWVCTEWTDCDENGIKTRDCSDQNQCDSGQYQPQTEDSCGADEGPTEVRLDVIFASVITIVSMGTFIVGLVILLKKKLKTGFVQKKAELIQPVEVRSG